jgi:hypothetical protein
MNNANKKPTINSIPTDREIRVYSRYKLAKKIGSGAFGDIYLGICRN